MVSCLGCGETLERALSLSATDEADGQRRKELKPSPGAGWRIVIGVMMRIVHGEVEGAARSMKVVVNGQTSSSRRARGFIEVEVIG